MRKWIIDTDIGSDDAVALMLAMLGSSVEILGRTTVCGNVPRPLATKNALATVELCNREIPVYKGAAAPLFPSLATAVRVHGAMTWVLPGLVLATPLLWRPSMYI